MVSDENHVHPLGSTATGLRPLLVRVHEFVERKRIDDSLRFRPPTASLAAGAKRVYQTGVLSTHIQGGCRMGTDPATVGCSTPTASSHDVRRLFVGERLGDPAGHLSVNPIADDHVIGPAGWSQYLAGGEHGYFDPSGGAGGPRKGARRPSPGFACGSSACTPPPENLGRPARPIDQQRLAPRGQVGQHGIEGLKQLLWVAHIDRRTAEARAITAMSIEPKAGTAGARSRAELGERPMTA